MKNSRDEQAELGDFPRPHETGRAVFTAWVFEGKPAEECGGCGVTHEC